MADKQNITIQLAGQPKMSMAIDRNDEEVVRRAEKLVNDLWYRWATQTFAADSPLKVMARVAFQFALLYLRDERSMADLKDLDDELDNLVKNLPGLEQR